MTSDCVISGEILSVEGSKVTISETFKHGPLTNQLTIYGTREQPLFRLSEIEKLLGKSNLRGTVANYDADEKVVRIVYTSTGNKEAIFLTEEGIMTLMHNVRGSNIAKTFRRWVAKVVKKIMLEGRYELQQKSLEEAKKITEDALVIKANAEKQAIETFERQHNLLLRRHRKGQSAWYLALVAQREECDVYKAGSTDNLQSRIYGLKRDFTMCYLRHVVETPHHRKLEDAFKNHPLAKLKRFSPKTPRR